jgi:hypothetical protein
LDALTEEHVIPQSIGGDARTVIKVCARCNSLAGNTVDSWVSKHSWLRAIALCSGNLMKRQERHESTAILKDGRRLVGHLYWVPVGRDGTCPAFQPRRVQPDGSRWVSEKACRDQAKIPAHINVYREEMLEWASFTAARPEGANLEPAMVKILLGISYLVRGMDVAMSPGFDIMRNCLTGMLDPRVTVTWAASLEELNKKGLPIEVKITEHTIWAECADGRTLIGGVSLFGRIIAEIKIADFGSALPGRCLAVENRWVT